MMVYWSIRLMGDGGVLFLYSMMARRFKDSDSVFIIW